MFFIDLVKIPANAALCAVVCFFVKIMKNGVDDWQYLSHSMHFIANYQPKLARVASVMLYFSVVGNKTNSNQLHIGIDMSSRSAVAANLANIN